MKVFIAICLLGKFLIQYLFRYKIFLSQFHCLCLWPSIVMYVRHSQEEAVMIHLMQQDQALHKLDCLPLSITARYIVVFPIWLLTSSSYFQKLVAVGIATRSGVASCTATGFYLNSGTACCQTDLCNGAHISYQMPIMLIVSLVIILAKLQWA
jgi:hypothetical protein